MSLKPSRKMLARALRLVQRLSAEQPYCIDDSYGFVSKAVALALDKAAKEAG